MSEFGSLCDDFFLSCYVNTEMDLPRNRETVLHYFERVSKTFPKMTNFYAKEPAEYILEEDKEEGSYRLMAIEPRRLGSAYFNPPSMQECDRQHEMMLDLAGPLLSLSSLDCESLDVTFGFDFNYRGNHDEVVSEAFAKDTKIGNVLGIPGAKVVDYEPTITLALDDQCRLQCRISVVTRTNFYQVRTNTFGEDSISVYFTMRQFWGHPQQNDFIASYRRQVELGTEIVREQVIPNFLIPLAEAIPPQAS